MSDLPKPRAELAKRTREIVTEVTKLVADLDDARVALPVYDAFRLGHTMGVLMRLASELERPLDPALAEEGE